MEYVQSMKYHPERYSNRRIRSSCSNSEHPVLLSLNYIICVDVVSWSGREIMRFSIPSHDTHTHSYFDSIKDILKSLSMGSSIQEIQALDSDVIRKNSALSAASDTRRVNNHYTQGLRLFQLQSTGQVFGNDKLYMYDNIVTLVLLIHDIVSKYLSDSESLKLYHDSVVRYIKIQETYLGSYGTSIDGMVDFLKLSSVITAAELHRAEIEVDKMLKMCENKRKSMHLLSLSNFELLGSFLLLAFIFAHYIQSYLALPYHK